MLRIWKAPNLEWVIYKEVILGAREKRYSFKTALRNEEEGFESWWELSLIQSKFGFEIGCSWCVGFALKVIAWKENDWNREWIRNHIVYWFRQYSIIEKGPRKLDHDHPKVSFQQANSSLTFWSKQLLLRLQKILPAKRRRHP